MGVAYEVTCTVTGYPYPDFMFLGVGAQPWPSWLANTYPMQASEPLILSGTPAVKDVGVNGFEINVSNSEGVYQAVGSVTVVAP